MKNNLMLIGLTGYVGAGKNTVADHLLQEFGFAQYAFVQPIKVALHYGFGIPPESLEERDKKEAVIDAIGKSPRQMMQLYGTRFCRRHLGDDIFLRLADKALESFEAAPEYQDCPGLVITDVRFDNEAQFIRDRGGIILQVQRPGTEPPRRWLCGLRRALGRLPGVSVPTGCHLSERGISPSLVDRVIDNSLDYVALEKRVEKVLGLKKEADPCLH